MARATLCLLNLQPPYCGVNLFLRADGECVSQRVAGGEESRYEFGVPSKEAMELMRLVMDEGFCHTSSVERNGVGDEAVVVIQLIEDGVQVKTVWKWANDRDARFDEVYERMVTLEKSQPEDTWVMRGGHDWDYRPDWMRG